MENEKTKRIKNEMLKNCEKMHLMNNCVKSYINIIIKEELHKKSLTLIDSLDAEYELLNPGGNDAWFEYCRTRAIKK